VSALRNFARVAVALLALAGAQAATAVDPSAYPWESRPAQNVAATAWTNDDIAAFLGTVTAAQAPLIVGDFRFASLIGDGSLQLVASVDYSGRRFFNTVLVVRRTATGYAVQKLPALDAESLAAAILDLDGDGRMELVLPMALTPYLGAGYPQAKWTAIYAWSGRLFVERTAAYAGYYREGVLAPLRQRLMNAAVANAAVPLAVARIEHDKALRVLPAANPGGGIATAQALASDADPKLRILGAAVAADLGSTDGDALLASLAADADRSVAGYARAASARSRTDRCANVDISVLSAGALPTIDPASAAPVRVAIALGAQARAAAAAFATVTFGDSGAEQSLVGCSSDGDGATLVCQFRADATGLRAGDGVATLIATRADGSCVKGQDAIEVVLR
jgi:hypothetical protein